MKAQEVINVLSKMKKDSDNREIKIIDKDRRTLYIESIVDDNSSIYLQVNSRIEKCPFCGEEDESELETSGGQYYVTCASCGSNGPESNDKFEAIDLWNRVK